RHTRPGSRRPRGRRRESRSMRALSEHATLDDLGEDRDQLLVPEGDAPVVSAVPAPQILLARDEGPRYLLEGDRRRRALVRDAGLLRVTDADPHDKLQTAGKPPRVSASRARSTASGSFQVRQSLLGCGNATTPPREPRSTLKGTNSRPWASVTR